MLPLYVLKMHIDSGAVFHLISTSLHGAYCPKLLGGVLFLSFSIYSCYDYASLGCFLIASARITFSCSVSK